MKDITSKHHRYKFWNYASPGMYFITICTKDMRGDFGNVVNGKMILSPLGKMAEFFIRNIPSTYKNTYIEAHQVMPDHVHIMIYIRGENELVQYIKYMPMEPAKFNGIHPLESRSLPSIINHYKGKVTHWAKNHNCRSFEWQQRYYDKIMFRKVQYHITMDYIKNNPLAWSIGKRRVKEIITKENMERIASLLHKK